jgi:hypothetical protein
MTQGNKCRQQFEVNDLASSFGFLWPVASPVVTRTGHESGA